MKSALSSLPPAGGSPTTTQPYAQAPPAGLPRRMTYEGVLNKSVVLFALLVVTAALTWAAGPGLWGMLTVAGSIGAFVLGLILAFKKEPSIPLILLFTVAEGMLVGGATASLNTITEGIAVYAVSATVVTLGVVLILFRSGKLRMSQKLTKIIVIAIAAYAVFSLLNFGLTLFGVMPGMGLRDLEILGMPIGIPLGILAVILASAALVIDFQNTENGVRAQIPAKYEWTASWSLLATIVWMYVEFLRLFHYFLPSTE